MGLRLKSAPGYFGLWAAAALALLGALAGCSVTNQLHSSEQHSGDGVDEILFSHGGIGFITPSAATGQEADKKALALSFSNVLQARMPNARVVSLPELLTAVNQAGLAGQYKDMFSDFEHTGIFEQEVLQAVGEACDVRYVGHLNLARFEQATNKRFGIAGMRLVDTKQATLRLFLEIWDTQRGAIVWIGSEELQFSYDTGKEKPVSFATVAEQAANDMIDQFPDATGAAAAARHARYLEPGPAETNADTADRRAAALTVDSGALTLATH